MNQNQIFIIEPGLVERHYWLDLSRYRELFYVLAWRDVSVRYKQTIIGLAWALLRPFLSMVVFTVIFGKIAKLPSEGAAPMRLWWLQVCCRGSLGRSRISSCGSGFVSSAAWKKLCRCDLINGTSL